MWLFRFRNYVRFERGLYLRCRQPLYRYAPYAGLDVVPVAVPIARPCAVGDVPDSSRHAPLRDDSHDSRLHGSVSRRRMSDWSRCQWNLPDGYPAYAGYPRRRTEIRMFGRTMDPVFAGCGQRLGWAWACNHREPPRAFGDRPILLDPPPTIRNHRRRRFSGACRRFAFSGKGSAGAFLIEVRRVMVPP